MHDHRPLLAQRSLSAHKEMSKPRLQLFFMANQTRDVTEMLKHRLIDLIYSLYLRDDGAIGIVVAQHSSEIVRRRC